VALVWPHIREEEHDRENQRKSLRTKENLEVLSVCRYAPQPLKESGHGVGFHLT
jgi:hypothetical protein